MFNLSVLQLLLKRSHSFLSNSCLALLQQYYTMHPSRIFIPPSNNLLVFESIKFQFEILYNHNIGINYK